MVYIYSIVRKRISLMYFKCTVLKSDDTSQFMSLHPWLQGDGGGGPALGGGGSQGRWLGLCWQHFALTMVEM